ncbi:mitochondrial carrier protein [Hokovirus HKV1]|uniref:Mitochondrial carrier protein n=1 Tax=Hokovirus HKV1 TaxID=1977638 RepID=A0A1V0SH63_9VIRU|nr:mitochondrial carrier protein [Hokovirus HKV1]
MSNKTVNQNIVSSIIASITAELLTIPICTTKTNYQTQIVNGLSIKDYCKNIYKTRGIKGFYNASIYASISQTISQTSKYTIYEYVKKKRNSNTLLDNMINSAASGCISSVLHHPFDYAKINTQINNNTFDIIKKNGIFITYTGYSKTLLRNICTSIVLPINDQYKKIYLNNTNYFATNFATNFNKDFINMFLGPFSASVTSTFILYPLDFIRNRHMANKKLFLGFNILNYYRGMSLGLFRNVLHFVTFMSSVELIKKYY